MKVGEYVRTKKGSIGKVLGIDYYIEGNGEELSNIESIFFDNVIDDIDKDIHSGVFQDCLKEYKSSPNIIDLIEIGDYINGMKITNKFIDEETGNIELEFNNGSSYLYPKSWNYEARSEKYKIKSIVTKERFSQMEYRIGE